MITTILIHLITHTTVTQMEAYHDIYHLHSNTLCLTLPKSFYPRHQKVEIIILPVDEPTQQESSPSTLTEFQKFLLNSPEMSDDEYQFLQEKRQHLQQWKESVSTPTS
jgi:hypothetical protein